MEDENLGNVANDATISAVDNAEKEVLQGEEPETDQSQQAEEADVQAEEQVENVEQGDDAALEVEQSADNEEVKPIDPGTVCDIEGEPAQTAEGEAPDEEAETKQEIEEADAMVNASAEPEPENEAVSEAEPEPVPETGEQAELEANEAEVIIEDEGTDEAQAEAEPQVGLEAEVQEADAEVQEVDAEVQEPEPEPEMQEPEPELEVQEAEPEPEVQEAEPEPEVQEAEPEPEVQDAETETEVQEAEAEPEVQEEEAAEPEAQEPDAMPAPEAEEDAAATQADIEEDSTAAVDAEEADASVEVEEADADMEDPGAQEGGAAEGQGEVVEMVGEDQQVSAEARIAQVEVSSSCAQQEQDAKQDQEEAGDDYEETKESGGKFEDAVTDDQGDVAATVAVAAGVAAAAGIAAVGVTAAVAAVGGGCETETETEATTVCDDGDTTELGGKADDGGGDSEDTVSVSTGGVTASGNSPTKVLDEIVEPSITTKKEAANADDSSYRVRVRKKFTPVTARMTELGSVTCEPGASWVVTTGLGIVALCYSCWLKVLGVVCRLLDVCGVKALKQVDLDMTMSATSENTQGGSCACCSAGNANGDGSNNSTDMKTSPWFANELASSAAVAANVPANEGPITTTTTTTTDMMGSITDWTVRPTVAADSTTVNNGRGEEHETPGMLFMPAMVLPSSTYTYDSWTHMAGCVTAAGKRYAIFQFRADLVYRAPTNYLKTAIHQARVSCAAVKRRALALMQAPEGQTMKFGRAFVPVVMMLDTILTASEDDMLWMLRTLTLQAVNPSLSSSSSSTNSGNNNSRARMGLQWLEFEHRLLRSSVKPHNAAGFFRTREAALATYMLFAQTCGGGGGRKEMNGMMMMKNMVKLLHMGNDDNVLDVIQYVVRESPRKLYDAVLSVLAVLIVQRCARQWVLMERESDAMIVSGVYPVNLARALMTDIPVEDDNNNMTNTTTSATTKQQQSHNKNKTITDWPKLRMEPYKHKYNSKGVSFVNAVLQHAALYNKLDVISSAWDIGLLARVDWAMRYGRRYVRADDVARVRAAATGMRDGDGGRGGGMVGVVDLSGMDARAVLALVVGAVIRVAGRHDTIFRLMEWYPMMASRGPDDAAGARKDGSSSGAKGKGKNEGDGGMNNGDGNHHHHMMAFGSYYGTFGRDDITFGSSEQGQQKSQQEQQTEDYDGIGMDSQQTTDDDGPWEVYAALPQVRVQDLVDVGLVTCIRTNKYVFNDVPGNEHVKLRVASGGDGGKGKGGERLVVCSRADKRARHVAFEARADQLFD